MKLTGAAMLVSRGMKVLQAAPAAYPYCSPTVKAHTDMSKTPIPEPFHGLRRDKTYGGYKKKIEYKEHFVDIRFDAEDEDHLHMLLPTALAFWKSRARWFKAFRDYCANELLTELNDSLDCGEDDHKEVTSAQVRQLLPVPFCVTFTSEYDDSGKIYFQMDGGEDEETLKENCFSVWGTLEDGVTSGEVDTLL